MRTGRGACPRSNGKHDSNLSNARRVPEKSGSPHHAKWRLCYPLRALASRKTGMSSYSEKLRDPRWQKRRLEIMNRDGFACRRCGSKTETLNVHHLVYRNGCDPWEYDDDDLMTLCEPCHEQAEDQEALKEFRRFMALFRGRDEVTKGIAACLSLWAAKAQPEFIPEEAGSDTVMRAAIDYDKMRQGYYEACLNWNRRLMDAGLFRALKDYEKGGAK